MDTFVDTPNPEEFFAAEILQAVARAVEQAEEDAAIAAFTESGLTWTPPAPLLPLGDDPDDPDRTTPT